MPAVLEKVCLGTNCNALYLPVYSPFLDPCEEAFSLLKSEARNVIPECRGERGQTDLLPRGEKVAKRMAILKRVVAECLPIAIPYLTKLAKEKRLAFAKTHTGWTAQNWGKVIFLDEMAVERFRSKRRGVWRARGERGRED